MGGEAVSSRVPEDQKHPQVLSARTYMLHTGGGFVKGPEKVFWAAWGHLASGDVVAIAEGQARECSGGREAPRSEGCESMLPMSSFQWLDDRRGRIGWLNDHGSGDLFESRRQKAAEGRRSPTGEGGRGRAPIARRERCRGTVKSAEAAGTGPLEVLPASAAGLPHAR